LARQARKQGLSANQCELVIGSLLRDGYLVKTTRGYAFRVNHGPAQKEYVDWKYSMLKNLVNSPPRLAGRCYYFRTVSHPFFNRLREQFYKGGNKILPYKLFKKHISPFMLAVWIMDDGSKDGKQVRINSQSFSKSENIALMNILQAKLGIKTTLNRDKDKYRLRICNDSMANLSRLIRSYFIPSMLYKLPL
jgi:recombination protein RecA